MNHRTVTAKQVTLIGLMLLLALFLAACGSKKSEAASPSSDTAAAADQNASEAEEDEDEEEAVQGDPAAGEQVFQSTCVACHGPDAKGIEGLGKSLHPSDSDFISSQTDAQLVEFIKKGRQPGEPGNTTGVAMPPKGGNPALSDEDLANVVAWLRTLE